MTNCFTCHDTRIVIQRDGYDSDDHHFVETASHLVPCPACSGLLRSAHALYDKYGLEDELPFGEWISAALKDTNTNALDALDSDGLRRVEEALLNILQASKKFTPAESMRLLFTSINDAYAKGLQTHHLFASASWWVAAEQNAEHISHHNRLENDLIAKRG